jgi:hypothetical protein
MVFIFIHNWSAFVTAKVAQTRSWLVKKSMLDTCRTGDVPTLSRACLGAAPLDVKTVFWSRGFAFHLKRIKSSRSKEGKNREFVFHNHVRTYIACLTRFNFRSAWRDCR